MFILQCIFGNFVVLVPHISNEFIMSMSTSWFVNKSYVLCMHAEGACINTNGNKRKQNCIIMS